MIFDGQFYDIFSLFLCVGGKTYIRKMFIHNLKIEPIFQSNNKIINNLSCKPFNIILVISFL